MQVNYFFFFSLTSQIGIYGIICLKVQVLGFNPFYVFKLHVLTYGIFPVCFGAYVKETLLSAENHEFYFEIL